MTPTTYQKPELRDANDNIIQQGAFGKNTALANATNDGWIDYVANDLEFLYDIAKDEIVPVPSLPASGQTNKTYLLTTTGVSYRWSGTEWVAVSSSEAVGRAETAANLAEQWATKTDGTVDGTEYSAKYYAGLAEASADDAQDTADDMADHLVQIDKNTGGVAKNSKRISNIEKLLQGNLYDYDTDDDSAYTKTVPSGALPYAGIEQIGGKTVVWNQLSSMITSSMVVTSNGVTFTFDSSALTCTLSGTASGGNAVAARGVQVVQGHKYLLKGCPSGGGPTTYFQAVSGQSADEGNGSIFTESTGGTRYIIITVANGTNADGLVFRSLLFDLTLMFGAGNEPSTVAEFEAMFPADYYPYNAGTLLSAGVTDVESRINLFQNVTLNVGSIATADGTDATSNTRVRTGYISVKPNTTYTVNSGTTDPEFLEIYNYTDDAYIGYEIISASEYTFTTGATTTRVRFTFHYIDDSTITSAAIVNPSIIDTVTLSIPAEVQALDGYGWSAEMPGSSSNFEVGNYIDFERKKFVQRVDSVDLGTLTWTRYSSNYHLWYANIPTRKQDRIPWTGYPKDTLGYRINWNSVTNNDKSWTLDSVNSSYPKRIYICNSAYDNFSGTDVANDLSGKIAYYELATPIETDISAYLTDNLIEVGAGGTLTFPNANGDDYRIDVPSSETYMVDLQASL